MRTHRIIRTFKVNVSTTMRADNVSALTTFEYLKSFLMFAVKTKLITSRV